MLDLCCCTGFSLVAVSRGCSPVVVNELLNAAASCCRAGGLGTWASVVVTLWLWFLGSRAQVQ